LPDAALVFMASRRGMPENCALARIRAPLAWVDHHALVNDLGLSGLPWGYRVTALLACAFATPSYATIATAAVALQSNAR